MSEWIEVRNNNAEIKNYNCLFCGKEIINNRDLTTNRSTVCKTCNVAYNVIFFQKDFYNYNIIHNYDFNFTYKNKRYGIIVLLDGEETSIWKGCECILTLNYVVDITPLNAEEKLPTLLNFS